MFSVVSETYDLINIDDNLEKHLHTDDWLLYRASSNAPLREARIRSFRPILRSATGESKIYAKLTIKPYIFAYDPDHRFAKSETFNAYDLYNTDTVGNLRLSLPYSTTYDLAFTPNLTEFVDNANLLLTQYFAALWQNGTLDFTNSIHHNTLTNYEYDLSDQSGLSFALTVPAGETVNYVLPVHSGVFLYVLINSSQEPSIRISTPEGLATAADYDYPTIAGDIVQAVDITGDLKKFVLVFDNDQFTVATVSNSSLVYDSFVPHADIKKVMSNLRSTVFLDSTGEIYRLEYDNQTLTQINTDRNITNICAFGSGWIIEVLDNLIYTLEYVDNEFKEYERIANYNELSPLMLIDVLTQLTSDYVFIYNDTTQAYRILEYKSEYDASQHKRVYSWVVSEPIEPQNQILDVSHISNYFVFTDASYIRFINILEKPYSDYIASSNNSFKISGSYSDVKFTSTTSYAGFTANFSVPNSTLTINDYLDQWSITGEKRIKPLQLRMVDSNKISYYSLCFALTNKILLFAVEIATEPVSLLYTSINQQIVYDLHSLGVSYLNPGYSIHDESTIYYFINFVDNYDDIVDKLVLDNYEDFVILRSPHINNVSQIIYSGFVEANVVFKKLDFLPSSNYFNVYITDANGKKLSYDDLKSNYSKIIIEVDYIYESIT